MSSNKVSKNNNTQSSEDAEAAFEDALDFIAKEDLTRFKKEDQPIYKTSCSVSHQLVDFNDHIKPESSTNGRNNFTAECSSNDLNNFKAPVICKDLNYFKATNNTNDPINFKANVVSSDHNNFKATNSSNDLIDFKDANSANDNKNFKRSKSLTCQQNFNAANRHNDFQATNSSNGQQNFNATNQYHDPQAAKCSDGHHNFQDTNTQTDHDNFKAAKSPLRQHVTAQTSSMVKQRVANFQKETQPTDFLKQSAIEQDRHDEKLEMEEQKRQYQEEDQIWDHERREKEAKLTDSEKEHLKKRAVITKRKGNILYNTGHFERAIMHYEKGLDLCPLLFPEDRAILYSNMAAAKFRLDLIDDSIECCNRAISLDPRYLRALFRRAQIYEEINRPHEALQDYKKVLELDPSHVEANIAVNERILEKIRQKDERLKEELLANLKRFGDMVLNPFGLSTDQLSFLKDPSTGSYSFSFKM